MSISDREIALTDEESSTKIEVRSLTKEENNSKEIKPIKFTIEQFLHNGYMEPEFDTYEDFRDALRKLVPRICWNTLLIIYNEKQRVLNFDYTCSYGKVCVILRKFFIIYRTIFNDAMLEILYRKCYGDDCDDWLRSLHTILNDEDIGPSEKFNSSKKCLETLINETCSEHFGLNKRKNDTPLQAEKQKGKQAQYPKSEQSSTQEQQRKIEFVPSGKKGRKGVIPVVLEEVDESKPEVQPIESKQVVESKPKKQVFTYPYIPPTKEELEDEDLIVVTPSSRMSSIGFETSTVDITNVKQSVFDFKKPELLTAVKYCNDFKLEDEFDDNEDKKDLAKLVEQCIRDVIKKGNIMITPKDLREYNNFMDECLESLESLPVMYGNCLYKDGTMLFCKIDKLVVNSLYFNKCEITYKNMGNCLIELMFKKMIVLEWKDLNGLKNLNLDEKKREELCEYITECLNDEEALNKHINYYRSMYSEKCGYLYFERSTDMERRHKYFASKLLYKFNKSLISDITKFIKCYNEDCGEKRQNYEYYDVIKSYYNNKKINENDKISGYVDLYIRIEEEITKYEKRIINSYCDMLLLSLSSDSAIDADDAMKFRKYIEQIDEYKIFDDLENVKNPCERYEMIIDYIYNIDKFLNGRICKFINIVYDSTDKVFKIHIFYMLHNMLKKCHEYDLIKDNVKIMHHNKNNTLLLQDMYDIIDYDNKDSINTHKNILKILLITMNYVINNGIIIDHKLSEPYNGLLNDTGFYDMIFDSYKYDIESRIKEHNYRLMEYLKYYPLYSGPLSELTIKNSVRFNLYKSIAPEFDKSIPDVRKELNKFTIVKKYRGIKENDSINAKHIEHDDSLTLVIGYAHKYQYNMHNSSMNENTINIKEYNLIDDKIYITDRKVANSLWDHKHKYRKDFSVNETRQIPAIISAHLPKTTTMGDFCRLIENISDIEQN